MNSLLIVYLLAFIIVMWIVFKVVKTIKKTIFTVFLLLLAITIIAGVFVYKDIGVWKTNLYDGEMGLGIIENDTILAITTVQFKEYQIVNFSSGIDINMAQSAFEKGNISGATNAFKVMLIDTKFIEQYVDNVSIVQEIGNENVTLDMTKTQILAVLRSNEPKKELANLNKNFDLTDSDIANNEVKAMIMLLTLQYVDKAKLPYLLDNIEITPSDSITKMIKAIPMDLFSRYITSGQKLPA